MKPGRTHGKRASSVLNQGDGNMRLLLKRRLLATASIGALLGAAFASACASGGEADAGVSGKGAKGGTGGASGADGGGTAGTGTGGSSASGGTSTGGSSATGGGGATGGTGAISGGSAGEAGGAGMAGEAGMAGGTTGGTDGTGTGGTGTGGTGGGAREICDGLDNDGDGIIDGTIPPGAAVTCTQVSMDPCPTGDVCCADGQLCVTQPGSTSKICVLPPLGAGDACDTGQQGVCKAGTRFCRNGSLNCVRNEGPTNEICDGLDNNCTGAADEGNPGGNQSCDTGKPGICAPGRTQCSGGSIVCNQENQAQSTESCNGQDDDCDGQTDEEIPTVGTACTVSGKTGACAAGTIRCPSTGQELCEPKFPAQTNPEAEKCDGIDNNCNGTTDEDAALAMCSRNCGLGGSIPNVGGIQCVQSPTGSSATCVISSCPAGKKNNDGNPCNGCEDDSCVSNPPTNTCASANSIPVGQSVTGQLVNLNEVTWYRVQFVAPSTTASFAPTIQLAAGASDYRLDIFTSCASAAASTYVTCPAAGSISGSGNGQNIGTWSMNFNEGKVAKPCGGQNQGACTNSSTAPSEIIIKVTRDSIGTGTNPECQQFTIAVSQ